jgi:hypothetical protein
VKLVQRLSRRRPRPLKQQLQQLLLKQKPQQLPQRKLKVNRQTISWPILVIPGLAFLF